jgi:hypothetical protein
MATKYKHTYSEHNALMRDLKRIFKHGDEREFMQILRKYGIKDEDPRFVEILKMFRAERSGKI